MKRVAVLCNNIGDGFRWLQANKEIIQFRMEYRLAVAKGIEYHVINSINQVLGIQFTSYEETPGFMNPRLLEETQCRVYAEDNTAD